MSSKRKKSNSSEDKCYTNIKGNCIGFIFDKSEDCEIFNSIFEKAKYEYNNQNSLKNSNNEKNEGVPRKQINTNEYNYNYLYNVNEENEKDDEEENEQEEDNNKSYGYEIMDIDEEFKEIESSNEGFNKFSFDSLTNDRTYCITNDNKLVSYKIKQEDYIIEKISSKPILQEYQDNGLKVKNGLLHRSENNILFLSENNPYSLYQYDLEKEKVVNEWNIGNVGISDICSMKKIHKLMIIL